MRANTDWFRDAKWGMCMHFLADEASGTTLPEITVDDWNRRIDRFDVKALVNQLVEVKAGYLLITIGQNSGFYLSPNATFDKLVPRTPSHLARRDLIADLIAELAPTGIRLMVYLPSHAPANDRFAVESLRCTPHWDGSSCGLKPGTYVAQTEVDERLSEFQRNWEAIIREWSLRWGHGVHGWWFDGCWTADHMYHHADEPNFGSFAAAAKAGNPNSMVAFNPGEAKGVMCMSEYEDYTAGEVAGRFPQGYTAPWCGPGTRYVNGSQYHILSFLGDFWGKGMPRFCDEFVIGYTKDINRFGGVVTWDVPPTAEGVFRKEFLPQLKALGNATR